MNTVRIRNQNSWLKSVSAQVKTVSIFLLLSAVEEPERAAAADRQQDGVRAARLRAGPRRGLPRHAQAPPRRVLRQGLHLQLGAQVDEHGDPAREWRIPRLHQGCQRDHSRQVYMRLMHMSLAHELNV